MTKKIYLLLLITFGITLSTTAQVTTSAISGKVSENKEPIIKANIIAIHKPSGTRYKTTTNTNGQFDIEGMRTGGPYIIEFSCVGYEKTIYNNITLELGNDFEINVTMKKSPNILKEVVITGTNSKKLLTGIGDNFTTYKIRNTPTVNRNIYDVIKNMPAAQINKTGGISFAGTNNRYNSFMIDGTVSNDVFGLTFSGTNGGRTNANPISLEAIQEIQVVIAPFDIRQGCFTGGAINVITKQGTNELHSSAYNYYTNENMYGRYSPINNYKKQILNKQNTSTYGLSIEGPIVKNKLFFFSNIEKITESYPSIYYPECNATYITADMAKQIADKYYTYTGIKENYDARNLAQCSMGLLTRIDWNINANNKLALRYQYNNSFSDNYYSTNSSYYFNKSAYRMKNRTTSLVSELNSYINNSLYNEFRGSISFVRDIQKVPYEAPTVLIKGNADNNYVTSNIGTECSSGANSLNQNIYTFEDNLSWYIGNHSITIGTHNEIFHIKNLFIQYYNGEWVFNSLTSFLNDMPSQFLYKYADPKGYIPKFNAGQFSFYTQDKWNINNEFNLTYGIRFDIPNVFDKPTTNDIFNAYAQSKNYDIKVGQLPSIKVMISPRIGFRWYINATHKSLVRGGLGLFTGRIPFVWISNAFTNDGVEQKGTTINTNIPSMTQYAYSPTSAMNSTAGKTIKPDICTIDKKFKYPQVFRIDLALEQKLPWDMKLTLEGLYSKTLNNVYFKNFAMISNGKVYAVSGEEKSSAPYYSIEESNYNSIIHLENTNVGYTYNLLAKIEKNFTCGVYGMLSYTYGHSKAVFDGTASIAYSNWKNNYAYDSNQPRIAAYSRFDIPNRIVATIGYTTPKYINNLFDTDISLIYTGQNGMRYNLTMNEMVDYNGDGALGNSLLYIPNKDELNNMNFVNTYTNGQITMTAEESRTNYEKWIENNRYAKTHRGEYAQRNCCQTPWENCFDLHVAQNIYVQKNVNTKIQFTLDIINFGNLINKRWGYYYASIYNVSPLQVTGIDSKSRTASFAYNKNNTAGYDDISSRWHAQIGIRLIF